MARAWLEAGVLAVLLSIWIPARAEPEPHKPWRAGVSAEQMAEALRHYERGNDLFVQRNFVAALEEYRKAIAHWDHPAIRFNMAECLVSLVQPLEAYQNLVEALKYGPEPFESEDLHKRGVLLQNQLLKQLGQLEVHCDEPGSVVSLDGKTVFTAPSKAVIVLRPGAHQIVTTRVGFLTATTPVVLSPGEKKTAAITLVPIGAAIEMQRRWKPWVPWAVAGVGAGIALVGLPFSWRASENLQQFDDEIKAMCPPPSGCQEGEVDDEILNRERRAQTQRTTATVLFAVGGVAATAGIVMAFLNQPHAYRPPSAPKRAAAGVRPMITNEGGGIALCGTFE